MAKSSRGAGSVLYRAVMFVVVSIFAGVLVAGLFIPFAGMAGTATKAVAAGMENLPADLETPPQAEKSTVLMGNGEVLAQFYDENRTYVKLDEIAPVMRQAQVAIEDHRFYEHGALDTKATMRALVRNSSSSGGTQGGSSLTQQYVKMVQVETAHNNGDTAGMSKAQERSVARKIQELRYAIALEKRLSKDEILERYLNIAYYGDGAYGVELAAHHYFNSSAKNLTLDQAALLAGLVQNPVATDPVHFPRISLDRRNVVLNRMADLNIVPKAEADAAKQVAWDPTKVQQSTNGCVSTRYPFLCDYVRRSLESMPTLGANKAERSNQLKRGGLVIETQIDPRTQDAAEKAIRDRIDARDPVISVMTMIQPGTGLILAMAQNRPKMGANKAAGETYYNYAVAGPQSTNDMGGAEGYQAGSTFKAFTAAAAIEAGTSINKTYNAANTMDYSGQTFRSCSGKFRSGDYQVKNSTGHDGVMDMRTAAMWSVNNYFIQLERDTGICEATQMAEKAGVKLAAKGSLTGDYSNYPSFTLGAAEVTPISMAEAYATFAARGKHCDPVIIKKVTNKQGKDIPVSGANCKQVMDPKTADGINEVLQSVMNGTGQPAYIPGGYQQAGKTGTIDDNQAVWFAGYTPEVAGAAMIAIDKTNDYWKKHDKSLKGVYLPVSHTSLQGTGGGDAGQDIYRPSMTAALQGKPRTRFSDVGTDANQGKAVQIPNTRGMTEDEATSALQDAGFEVGRTSVPSNKEAGTYLGAEKNSGTAPKGSTINLTYSSGPAGGQQSSQTPGAPGAETSDAPATPTPQQTFGTR